LNNDVLGISGIIFEILEQRDEPAAAAALMSTRETAVSD